MTIVNYTAKAQRLTQKLLNDSKISDKNKALLTRFMKVYDVSQARRTIFMERIGDLLRHTPDIEKDIHDPEQMADLFNRLKRTYAIATYATALSVAKRFARWLCGGRLPQSIDQLRYPSRSKIRRNLEPNDMWSWEEGLEAVRTQYSVQVKAMFLTQLDAGFRPTELLGLSFGDIESRGDLAIARVRAGKTGPRNVVMYRCVPILSQWIQTHPTRRRDDPLWILEHADKSHRKTTLGTKKKLTPYTYAAVCKRFRNIKNFSEIDKPVDLYALRHSSCVLDKKDNLPLDNAAERHGHSVKFFVEVYGRLSVEDTLNRFRLHYGLKSQSLDNPATAMTPNDSPPNNLTRQQNKSYAPPSERIRQ